LIAYAIGYGGGGMNFFLWYDIPIPPIGNIFVSTIAAIVGYTIVRQRLMDISVVVEKGLIYAIMIFLVGVPLYLILFFAQWFYFGSVNTLFQCSYWG
jgi:hypothetical protein